MIILACNQQFDSLKGKSHLKEKLQHSHNVWMFYDFCDFFLNQLSVTVCDFKWVTLLSPRK